MQCGGKSNRKCHPLPRKGLPNVTQSTQKGYHVDAKTCQDLQKSCPGTKILIYPKYLKPRPTPKINRNDISYPVKSGDTINKISLKFGITKDWILKWNEIEDESLIYPGDILNLKLSELN